MPVVSAGPAGLSCAYYLARVGCAVTLMDRGDSPGGSLPGLDPSVLPPDALGRDLEGVLASGVECVGGFTLGGLGDAQDLLRDYRAVFLATGAGSPLGLEQLQLAELAEGAWVAGNVVAGGSPMRGECSAVQAVADGRRAAQAIARIIRESAV